MASRVVLRPGLQGQQISSSAYPQVAEIWIRGEKRLHGMSITGFCLKSGHGGSVLRLSRQGLRWAVASSEGPVPGVSFKGVPVFDKSEESRFKLFQAPEARVPEDAALKNAKPDLDLVDPGRVDRCVDEVESTAMPVVEGLPSIAMMDVEVVPDHVDSSNRVAFGHGFHKRHEIGLSSLRTAMAEDLPRPCLESRQQGPRPMAPILELKASLLATASALRRESAFQGLNARLLVDTQNRSPLWGLHIQLADPLDFWLKLRVRTVEPHSQTMGAQKVRS